MRLSLHLQSSELHQRSTAAVNGSADVCLTDRAGEPVVELAVGRLAPHKLAVVSPDLLRRLASLQLWLP